MTKQEVFEEYYDEIKERLITCSEYSMRSKGRVRFVIYAGEDGGVQVIEDVSGGKAKLDDPSMYMIAVVDYGTSFNPEEYLLYHDEDDDEEYEDEVTDDSFGMDDDAICRAIATTDWEAKMDEILDLMYYER